MSVYQRNLVHTSTIWTGLAVFGVCLGFMTAYSLGFPTVAALVGGWMVFWIVMNQVAKRVGWRTVLKRTALFLAGVPLALLLAFNHTLSDLLNPSLFHVGGNPSVAIFFWTLGLWSALCGLLSRSARGMVVALHLFNWLFWLGLMSEFGGDSGPLLLIPLGITLLLLGFSTSLIRNLALLPPFQKSWRADPAPKSDTPRDYEHGYQPVYQEGGNFYTMTPDEMDVHARRGKNLVDDDA